MPQLRAIVAQGVAMYCQQCGQQNVDGAVHCSACGAVLAAALVLRNLPLAPFSWLAPG